jgi:allophanate hydrolase
LRGWALGECRTAPLYRLFRLPGGAVVRPGMVRVAESGAAIAGEIWRLPTEAVGAFLANIPQPLGLGDVELDDGRRLKGFLCEAIATSGAEEITPFGGWRAFLAKIG